MSPSVHIDIKIEIKGKDILIFSRGPTQGLDNAMIRAEAEYSMDFLISNRKFCLSLHYEQQFFIC